jgi:hypothetical protein
MAGELWDVATVHPRYHSFYAFLLDEFWRRELPRSRRAWIQFFRPRDFIYSIAMHLCDRDDHDLTGGVTPACSSTSDEPPSYLSFAGLLRRQGSVREHNPGHAFRR